MRNCRIPMGFSPPSWRDYTHGIGIPQEESHGVQWCITDHPWGSYRYNRYRYRYNHPWGNENLENPTRNVARDWLYYGWSPLAIQTVSSVLHKSDAAEQWGLELASSATASPLSLLKPCDSDLSLITVHAKVVVKVLEEREAVPRVRRLEFQDGVHVDGEQRPEDLGVFHHQVAVPRKRLHVPY